MRELDLEITVKADQAKAELRETERHIDKTSDAAKKLDKAVSEAEKRLNKSFAEVEKGAAKLEREVEKLSQTSERRAKPAIDGLNSTLLKYASGAVVLAAVKSTADYANNLQDLASQADVSIRALSRFDTAARRNGASLDQVASAITTLQDRIGGGDRSLVKGLDRLGLSLESVRRMNPEEQFITLAREVAQVTNRTDQMTIANDLFGGSAKKLLPTLIEIANNYEQLPGLQDETVRSTAKLKGALDDLKGAGTNVLVEFLAPFGEALGMVADKLKDINANQVDWSKALPSSWGMPFNMLQGAYQRYSGWKAGDAAVGGIGTPQWYTDLVERGKAGNAGAALPPASGLFGTDQLFGFTSEIDRQINDQLKEQARLHKERGRAAEEAAKKAKRAAAEELAAWNDLLANNRALLADATRAIGEDFNLFFGRQFTPRGGVYQGQGYWGQTDIPTISGTDLGGVSGTMPGLSSAGNVAAWVYGPQRRMSAQERWNAQWRSTYANYGSWSEGFASAGNAIGTYGPALEDLARGDTEVLRATNVMGRGNRAKAGMMAGAAEGGRYGGPYGAAGGAVAGLLIGAFRNPMFEDIYNRVGANYDRRGISEDLARQIEDTTKTRFDGNRQAGEIYSLSSILRERQLDKKNITQMTARFRDSFSMRETGEFDDEELQVSLDASFGAFADYYSKIGGLADETFTEIIELQRRFGVEAESVTQYVEQQTGEALGGLYTFFETGTVQSAEAAKGLMGAAVLIFDEMKKGPEGVKGAMAELAPIFAQLDQALVDTGAETTTAYEDMRALIQTMANEDVANAVMAVEGLGQTMTGLNNAVLLNEDTYAGLARAITDTRNATVAQGADGEIINRLMQEDLQTIWELHKNNGWAVDEVTKALLDEAEAQGIVGQKFKDFNQQLLDLQKEGFTAIIDALGGEIPESWKDVEKASGEAEQKVKDDAGEMAASQDRITGSVDGLYDRLMDVNAWQVWRDAGVEAAEDVSYAVDAVSLGHSPGGIKEIPIKLREAIDAAHLFKRQAVADFEATEAAVNALSGEQEDMLRLLIEVGRPLDDIAYAMDLSASAIERFIDREREATQAAEDAARAVEQQRLETERMAESLLAMELRTRDEVGLLRTAGMDRDLLQLGQRQRDEIAAAEAMRPTLGAAVDQTIAFINQKFDLMRGDIVERYTEQAARERESEQQRRAQNDDRYAASIQRLNDQIALIGKTGLDRELLQLGFGRRDEMADIERMRALLSGPQIDALLLAVATKYARLETEARAEEARRVSGAALGGYVTASGVQYLAMGGNVYRGLFRPRGTDTVPAMLTPGEGVLSRRGMAALAELNRGGSVGESIVFEAGAIVVNGADDPEAVAEAILRRVERKRKLSRGRRAA